MPTASVAATSDGNSDASTAKLTNIQATNMRQAFMGSSLHFDVVDANASRQQQPQPTPLAIQVHFPEQLPERDSDRIFDEYPQRQRERLEDVETAERTGCEINRDERQNAGDQHDQTRPQQECECCK